MKKSTAILFAILTFFAGAFFGLLLAPIKGSFGSHNGNTIVNNYGKNDDESLDETSDLEALDGAND